MPKWKLFRRSKSKEEETESEESAQIEIQHEPEEQPEAEYHETLYSDDTPSKKGKKNREKTIQRSPWRDVKGIEEKIDDLHVSRAKKPSTEIDKRIDRITSRIKLKSADRKPSNVIYVVNRPQPGQVKGDWAVRGHGKIYSQHRTKENAIDAARKIAKERNATVMVQNTDGTFSEGFKPR